MGPWTWTLTGRPLGALGTVLLGTTLLAVAESAAAVWVARGGRVLAILAMLVWPGCCLYVLATDRSVPLYRVLPVMGLLLAALGATVWRVRAAWRRHPESTTLHLVLQGVAGFYVTFALLFVVVLGIYLAMLRAGAGAGAT